MEQALSIDYPSYFENYYPSSENCYRTTAYMLNNHHNNQQGKINTHII